MFVSVANAGVAQVRPLLECTSEYVGFIPPMNIHEWELHRFLENEIRINVLGLMNTHIYAAKQMVKQGSGGRILGAGSIASYRTSENLGPYASTKFAVRGFTEAAAKEWAKYGIRVNGNFVRSRHAHWQTPDAHFSVRAWRR